MKSLGIVFAFVGALSLSFAAGHAGAQDIPETVVDTSINQGKGKAATGVGGQNAPPTSPTERRGDVTKEKAGLKSGQQGATMQTPPIGTAPGQAGAAQTSPAQAPGAAAQGTQTQPPDVGGAQQGVQEQQRRQAPPR